MLPLSSIFNPKLLAGTNIYCGPKKNSHKKSPEVSGLFAFY
jgi:hypothetical protein